MKISASSINRFLFFKLPAAFLCGVRVKKLNDLSCLVTVKHRWINQNPFKSMYFAVQAMAAELSTGALVMAEVEKTGSKMSMLVLSNKCRFSKKATGKISFICNDGQLIAEKINEAVVSGDGQTLWMKSTGYNENNDEVSQMEFEWTIKVK